MLLVYSILIIGFLTLCYFLQRYKNFKKMLSVYPNQEMSTHYSKTPLGNFKLTIMMIQNAAGLGKIYLKEGFLVAWILFRPIVMVFNAETVKPLLTSYGALKKTKDYDLLDRWLGTGLLTSESDKWKTRRRLLTPSFHFQILEEFTPIVNEQTQTFLCKLRSIKDKAEVDILPLVNLLAIDLILETSTGVNIKAQSNQDLPYIKAIALASESFFHRAVRPYLWPDYIFGLTSAGKDYNRSVDVMKAFTKEIIRKRISILQNRTEHPSGGKQKLALLDSLLELSSKDPTFTESDICEEIDTFFFAGQDTTTSTLSFVLYCLGLYPEVQEKLYEEISSVVSTDPDAHFTSEDIKNLKYLDCVIKETHRIFTPVPQTGRISTEEININGCIFPKGTTFWILHSVLHMNPDIFADPEKYDPDRFLPENSVGRDPYAFIPFSAGPRNCIGQRFALNEIKLVVAAVVRAFTIKSLDPRDKILTANEFVCKPVGKLRLKIQERITH